MKSFFLIAVFFLTASGFAAANSKDERMKFGGEGCVAIVNTCAASSNALARAAQKVGDRLMINIVVKDGSPWSLAGADRSFAAAKATVAVFVVKDKNLPMSLIALESKWGVANVDGLDDECVMKSVMRVVQSLLGGGASKFPSSSMRPVFSRDDLVKKAGFGLSFDAIMPIYNYLPATGIKPYRLLLREEAIEEGLINADEAK